MVDFELLTGVEAQDSSLIAKESSIQPAEAAILKLNPKIETIQAVIVVPMLAPKTTPADCCKVKRPALTNVTTITVVAPDDWMTIVITRPVKRPLKRFPVITESARCKRSPALFCTPSLINFIPYSRKASEPINCKSAVTIRILL